MSTSRTYQIFGVIVCLAFILYCSSLHLHAQSMGPLSFEVTASATQVEVGDTVTVVGNIVKDGEPGTLGIPRFSLSVEPLPGDLQDEENPIFEPARPEAITPGGSQSSASFTLTAVRPGRVTFYMSVNGEEGFITDDGIAGTTFVTLFDRSAPVVVVDGPAEPVQIPEPLTITLFGAGLAGIAGYARRRRR